MSNANQPAWRQAMRPASFRGVPFAVQAAETQVGRRVQINEYPQRDEAWPEDLGRKARAFTVQGCIVGPDYMTGRDALIAALETKGPGQLVHPYYGERTVVLANPARISESHEEGGMARFAMDFVEAGENSEPSARADTQGQVDQQADAAMAAAQEDFADSFSLAGLADFAVDSVLDVAQSALAELEGLVTGLLPDMGGLAEFMSAAGQLATDLDSLLQTPDQFADQLASLFDLAGSAVGNASSTGKGGAAGAFGQLGTWGAPAGANPLPGVPRTTPTRVKEADNHEALAALVRRASLVQSAKASAAAEFESYDQAAAVRDTLAQQLDDEAGGAHQGTGTSEVPDPVFAALSNLRVAVVRDITARGANLARIGTVVLPDTLPALVAAWRIYGDAERDAEVVSRNRIRHPGFVPGGVVLQVLVG